MMRDYKFKQTEWPIRKKSSGLQKKLVRALLLLVVVAAGYALYQWIPSSGMLPAPAMETDPNVIPLELPPKPATAALPGQTPSNP